MPLCLSAHRPLTAKRRYLANGGSQVLAIGFASSLTVQHHYGWGRHEVYLESYQISKVIELTVLTDIFGTMGPALGRMSFIALVFKLFGVNKSLRWGLWALFATQFIINLVVTVVFFFQCSDIRALWDFTIHASCWNPSIMTVSCQMSPGLAHRIVLTSWQKLGYFQNAFNGVTDLFLTCLPAVMMSKLHLKKRTKFYLSILLGLSLLYVFYQEYIVLWSLIKTFL
jgi:hypothetical protein